MRKSKTQELRELSNEDFEILLDSGLQKDAAISFGVPRSTISNEVSRRRTIKALGSMEEFKRPTKGAWMNSSDRQHLVNIGHLKIDEQGNKINN